jgi:hypothetical protein
LVRKPRSFCVFHPAAIYITMIYRHFAASPKKN